MEERNILRERANRISKESKKSAKAGKKRFIVFETGDKFFAMRYEEIVLIAQNREIRLLPRIRTPFLGIVNFKGTMYNVADIKLLLNKSDQSNRKNLIFLKDYYLALCFDKIDDLVFIDENAIKTISNSDFAFVSSFFTHEEDDVYVINLKEFYETCTGS